MATGPEMEEFRRGAVGVVAVLRWVLSIQGLLGGAPRLQGFIVAYMYVRVYLMYVVCVVCAHYVRYVYM